MPTASLLSSPSHQGVGLTVLRAIATYFSVASFHIKALHSLQAMDCEAPRKLRSSLVFRPHFPAILRRLLKFLRNILNTMRPKENIDSAFADLVRPIVLHLNKPILVEVWEASLRNSLSISKPLDILDVTFPNLEVHALHFLKKRKGVGHEAIVVDVISPDGEPFLTVLTDRTTDPDRVWARKRMDLYVKNVRDSKSGDPLAMPSLDSSSDSDYSPSLYPNTSFLLNVLRTSSASSTTWEAKDQVTFRQGWRHDEADAYDVIEMVTFDGDRRPSFLDFFLVVCATHSSFDKYRLFHQQCFWYADIISETLKRVVGKESYTVQRGTKEKPTEVKKFSPTSEIEKSLKTSPRISTKLRKGCWKTLPVGQIEDEEVDNILKEYEVLKRGFSVILDTRMTEKKANEETNNLIVAMAAELDRLRAIVGETSVQDPVSVGRF